MIAKTNRSEAKFKFNKESETLEWNEMKNKPTIQKIKSRNSPNTQSENIMH